MRLTFDLLDALLISLGERLLDGKISVDSYMREFDRLLAFAGWTEDQLVREIDKRWATGTNTVRRSRNAFLC